uniref:Putative secreted protein n=1 Tax=Anopheles darlingi TaxID=43151 RepID=A0A2M4D2Q0_ANODA
MCFFFSLQFLSPLLIGSQSFEHRCSLLRSLALLTTCAGRCTRARNGRKGRYCTRCTHALNENFFYYYYASWLF